MQFNNYNVENNSGIAFYNCCFNKVFFSPNGTFF
jgi:hypothetical protein